MLAAVDRLRRGARRAARRDRRLAAPTGPTSSPQRSRADAPGRCPTTSASRRPGGARRRRAPAERLRCSASPPTARPASRPLARGARCRSTPTTSRIAAGRRRRVLRRRRGRRPAPARPDRSGIPGGGAIQVAQLARRAPTTSLAQPRARPRRWSSAAGSRSRRCSPAARAPGHRADHRPDRGGRARRRETEDLSRRIEVDGDDEVGRLAAQLQRDAGRRSRLAAELADSVDAQRQLVADASHELRTPVTSLRTNIEVLQRRTRTWRRRERARMLDDVDAQIEELGAADRRRDRARPRRRAPRGAVDRRAPRRAGRARRSSGCAATRPGGAFELDAEPSRSSRRARPARRARSTTCSTTRSSSSPAGEPIEVAVARRGADRPRPRPRHRARRAAARLRPLLPRRRRPRGCRARGSAWRSSSRSPRRTAARVAAANAAGGGAVFSLRLARGVTSQPAARQSRS